MSIAVIALADKEEKDFLANADSTEKEALKRGYTVFFIKFILKYWLYIVFLSFREKVMGR